MAAEPNTRERILSEAIRLFAERGFRGTTVGDIEEAAGLAPRTGGLYKHFRSKDELLEAVVEHNVHDFEELRPLMELRPRGDLRAELMLVGRVGLHELANQMDLVKVLQKEGDRFPALKGKFDERIISGAQDEGADVVSRLVGDELDESIVAALAAVA